VGPFVGGKRRKEEEKKKEERKAKRNHRQLSVVVVGSLHAESFPVEDCLYWPIAPAVHILFTIPGSGKPSILSRSVLTILSRSLISGKIVLFVDYYLNVDIVRHLEVNSK